VSLQPSPPRRDSEPGSAAGVGGVLRGLHFPWLGIIAGCAREDALAGRALVNFREGEAHTLRALVPLLVPVRGDADPSRAAVAVHFVDRALDMRFFADAWPVLRTGLADLDDRARTLGASAGFASLDAARQVAMLRQFERTTFVATLRELVAISDGADAFDDERRSVA
jgi:hypothetical protein